MRHRLPLLIVLAMATLCLGACASSASPPREATPSSDSLPRTRVTTLDGSATDLTAVLRGRAALVSFWATWCEACVDEIDALKRLEDSTRVRADALVVGVAVGEHRDVVAAFASRRGLGYTQLVDEDFRLADALGQHRVPSTLVVDRNGRIVFRGGALDSASLAAFRSALDAVE